MNENVTRVIKKMYRMYLPQVRLEARGGEVHGAKSETLLKYTDSLDSTQKGKIDRSRKSGGQRRLFM